MSAHSLSYDVWNVYDRRAFSLAGEDDFSPLRVPSIADVSEDPSRILADVSEDRDNA
jgi:hypothetical protein